MTSSCVWTAAQHPLCPLCPMASTLILGSDRTCPLDSSGNITWDQCWWFQFWCLCANIGDGLKFGYNWACKTIFFIKIATTKLVKTIKNWNMFGFVILTCQFFSSYSFWLNLLYTLWFSLLFFPLSESRFCTRSRVLMVTDLATRHFEHYSSFLLVGSVNAIFGTEKT